MQNVCLHVAYDGTDFLGFQILEEQRTVGRVLRSVISEVAGRPTRLIAAGRTDAGVHAEDMVLNFLSARHLPPSGWAHQIQSRLPADILLRRVDLMEDNFHSRFAPHTKTYRYEVENAPFLLPTNRRTRALYSYSLDFDAMQQAVKRFVGEHNFSGFCMVGPYDSTFRILENAEIRTQGTTIIFHFRARGFLRKQIRFMVGAILSVGRGALSLQTLEKVLEQGTRSPVSFAAPAKGLILESIDYHARNGDAPVESGIKMI